MKNKYKTPTLEIALVNDQDVISTSTETDGKDTYTKDNFMYKYKN